MTDNNSRNDPFAPAAAKTPSVEFAAIGDGVSGVIMEAPSLVQSIDIDTGERETWPDGNPKFKVVIKLKDAVGQERNLWIPKPSNMYAGFQASIARMGRSPRVGDTVKVTFIGTEPAKNPKFTRKVYEVSIDGVPF